MLTEPLKVTHFSKGAWIAKGEVGLVTVNDRKHLPCVLAALEKFFADEANEANEASVANSTHPN